MMLVMLVLGKQVLVARILKTRSGTGTTGRGEVM